MGQSLGSDSSIEIALTLWLSVCAAELHEAVAFGSRQQKAEVASGSPIDQELP
jgi:hypothetical protein